MSKTTTSKTKSIKKNKYVTSTMVAEVACCSPEMVVKVWSGERSNATGTGENIEVATMYLNECIYQGMEKAKQIIGKSTKN